MKITAVLITKDKEYPQEVLDHVKSFGFDEIIIKTESPHVYQRYLEALKAKNDVIYVQDDDCISDIGEIYKHYDGKLTNGISQHHYNYYQNGITLVGWGCFFPKEMIKNMKKYMDKYGEDFHLFREADRIFTYLNQPHNTIVMPHRDLPQVNRMSTTDPNHYFYLSQALEKLHLLK